MYLLMEIRPLIATIFVLFCPLFRLNKNGGLCGYSKKGWIETDECGGMIQKWGVVADKVYLFWRGGGCRGGLRVVCRFASFQVLKPRSIMNLSCLTE